jgi:adenylate cyclase
MEPQGVFKDFCDDLVDAGLPLLRAHLAMQTLHPLLASVDLTWVRGESFTVSTHEHATEDNDAWLCSPLYWMLSNKKIQLRQNFKDQIALDKFPIFGELQQLGGTDYLALVTPFGDPKTVFERQDGIVTSWVSDSSNGFDEHHIECLKSLQPYVALVAKLSKKQNTAFNVVSAYLGEEIGRQVLEGKMRLGDIERIPAVIWMCDLRNSTPMAEQLTADEYLHALNAYFDCTAGAVLNNGGQVLSFIGDAVLAVFPVTDKVSLSKAARQALAASRESRQRMTKLNRLRAESLQNPMAFGLALHVGDVHYGNIGVPNRIEFSVIGSAVNEVSRLESLTKNVGETLLVSRAFKDAIDLPCRNLGTHSVKGVSQDLEVFAPIYQN